MTKLRRRARLARWIPLLGLALSGGCLANVGQNLDRVLAPGALANALTLPYSSVAGLSEWFVRLFFG